MKKESKKLYEGIYIFNASLSEDALKTSLKRVVKAIEENEGEVQKIHDMGRKKLAYEIKGHKQGYYFLLYFVVAPSVIVEMWKKYHLNEDLIRFMTMCTDVVLEEIQFKSLLET